MNDYCVFKIVIGLYTMGVRGPTRGLIRGK